MEEPSSKSDAFTRKIVKEAGLSKPSPDFLSNVMEAVNQTAVAPVKVYQPLLSKVAWLVFSAFLLGSMALLYFLPEGEVSFFDKINFDRFSFELPSMDFHFSKTFIYGLGVLALFVIQIPFLKIFLDRRKA